MTTILTVNCDGHTGSSMGLSPPTFERDDGSAYLANKGQLWAWENWLLFWERIRELKQLLKAEVVSVFPGDSLDRNRHATFERVSENPIDIFRLSEQVYKPASSISDVTVLLRGTAVHTGLGGWLEEELGERLGTARDPETGQYAWWYARLGIEELLCEFCHAPTTTGYLPHTESAAPGRMSFMIRSRCAERDERVPDMVFFGHTHNFNESGIAKRPRVFYCPGWQLPYDWVLSTGKGLYPKDIGGLYFIIEGKEVEVFPFLLTVERKKQWSIQTLKATFQPL